MERTWSDGHCHDCGKTPKLGKNAFLTCSCEGKRWEKVAGVRGTREESEMLKSHGFWFATSADNDEYYVGSLNRLVWLYDDGTWTSDPRPPRPGMSLDEYLRETDQLTPV